MKKTMKRLLSLSLAAAITAAVLGGCSRGEDSSGSSDASQGNSQSTADRSKPLVIYSNSTSNGQDAWLLETAKEAGYQLQIVSIDGGSLGNRLIAEKNNGVCDVIFGLNAVEYEKLKKENLLMQYRPDWADEVDLSLGDPDGYYYPTVLQPLVCIYNPDMKNPPKDWIDLIKPEYKDQYTIFTLTGGTVRTILASILVRYADPNGELGISAEGWDVMKQFIQNGHIQVSGEDYIGDVISGARPMSMMWGSGVVKNQKERDYTFGIMVPEIGCPYVCEQTAIVASTKNMDLAQQFVNWFGSAEIQEGWSKNVGAIPVQPKALEAADPEIKEFMNKVRPQEMDWGLVSDKLDSWMEKIELEFVK